MPQKIKVACVCSAWLEVSGQSGDTVAARKRFIDDHRECREKLDADVKRIAASSIIWGYKPA